MKTCKVEGCNNKHKGKGYCDKHLKKFNKYGDPLYVPQRKKRKTKEEKQCMLEGCTNKHYAKGLCEKHYAQQRKGKEFTFGRTKFDPNEIIEYNDYAEIILYDENGIEKAKALIDLDDVELCKQFKWYLSHNYVTTQSISLHRMIMDCPNDMVVDHINHNTLDNRKENLRICTNQENLWNSSMYNDNEYRGTYKTSNNKYIARIRYNQETIYLGTFDTQEEAFEVYKHKSIELYKEFSPYWNKD